MKINPTYAIIIALLLVVLIIVWASGASAQTLSVGIGHDYNNRNQPTALLNYSHRVLDTPKHKVSLVTRNVFGDNLADFQAFAAYDLPTAFGKYKLTPQIGATCIDRYGIARCHALFGLGANRGKANTWVQWFAPTEGRRQYSEWRVGGSYQIAKTNGIAASLVIEAQSMRTFTAATGRANVDGGARVGVLFSRAISK